MSQHAQIPAKVALPPAFYFIDTNAASAFVRGKDLELVDRVTRYLPRRLLSSVVLSELEYGARKWPERHRHRQNLRWLRGRIPTVQPFDEQAAQWAGEVQAYLENVKPNAAKIGKMDALIAGHALARGAGVITHNVREFAHVPGLVVLDWQSDGQ